MTETGFVREALASFLTCTEVRDKIAVPTQCLYPSNASVVVYITGGPQGARVSDEGGAMDTLSAHGRLIPDADRFLSRFCKRASLLSENGKIYSPVVPMEGLVGAISLVANASSSAAHWGIEHVKAQQQQRDLRKELGEILKVRFRNETIEAEGRITGKSNRLYHFDHVVRFRDERVLILDAVLPDANSVNSHAIAHFDVRQKEDRTIVQRLVYDDLQSWEASDLNLLQMAATVVPFSGVTQSLDRLRPH